LLAAYAAHSMLVVGCAAEPVRGATEPVIYGEDTLEVIAVDAGVSHHPAWEVTVGSVVALVDTSAISGGAEELRVAVGDIGGRFGMCADERMAVWPSAGFCSGVWVAQGVVATARHCVADRALDSWRVVEGFRFPREDEGTSESTLPIRSALKAPRSSPGPR
jgi:hypothetical protein